MTPERYQTLRRLYEDVIELPAIEREAALFKQCADATLVNEVLAVIAANDGVTRGQISRPLSMVLASASGRMLQVGDVIGVWKIEGEIGQGGMGSVFLAKRIDGHFTQTAALKFLKGLPSSQRLDYFTRERQLLANLSHPDIARLLDGGATAEGQPYLVMEFIDGAHIDEYCQRNELSTDQILNLFLIVCGAVAAAHRQLIVHCDLKPSNILVNKDGRPILLDFGIATLVDKVADGATLSEPRNSPAYTPRYSSPEQREGRAVSTVSDIYSLGVLLGELVGDELNAQPELAAIVGKAAAADAANRYPSVDALIEDLRRFRTQLPVRAYADTNAYVAKKFLRRRWPVVAAVALFMLTVAGFTWKVITESQRAQAAERVAVSERDSAASERDRARAAEARATADRDVTAAAQAETARERDAARRERDRATTAEQLAAQQRNLARSASAAAVAERDKAKQSEAEARDEQAKAKLAEAAARQTGDFLLSVFDRANPGLDSGDPPASKLIAAAEERLETRLSGQPETQALLYNLLGKVRNNMGNINQSAKNYLRAIELERTQNRPLVLARLLTSFARLDLTSFGGKHQGAALANEALELAQRHAPAESQDVAFALNMVGFALMSRSKDKEATPILQNSLAIGEKLDREGGVTLDATIYLAQNQMKLLQFEAAETYYRRALSIRAKLSGEGHPLWWTVNEQLAMALRGQRKYADAEPIMRSSLAMRQKTHGRDSNESLRPMLALALLMRDMGKLREELELNRAAVEGFERTLGRKSVWFLLASNNLAITLAAVGDQGEALRILREVVPPSKQAWPPNHETPATFERNLGRVLGEMGLIDEARTHLRASLETNEIFYGAKHREPGLVVLDLALNEARTGDLTQAENHLQRYESMLPLTGLDHRVNAAKVRALVLAKRGEIDEAMRANAEVEKLTGEMLSTKDPRYWVSMVPRAELLAQRGEGNDRAQAAALARQILDVVTPVLVPHAPVLEKLRQLLPR